MVDLLHGITYTILMDYIIIAKSICNFSEMELLKDVIQFPIKDERMYLATYEEEYITFCKEILHLYKKLDIVCLVVFFVSLTNIE